MAGHFRVTYDIVTPESAEHGDFAECGYAHPGGWRTSADDAGDLLTLREALSVIGHHYCRGRGAGLEDSGRWFSTLDSETDYRTGAQTRYSIHPPRTITGASYGRLVRLLTGRRPSRYGYDTPGSRRLQEGTGAA